MRLAVTLGDPSGVGPEVALKALAAWRPRGVSVVILGDRAAFEAARRRFAPGLAADSARGGTGPSPPRGPSAVVFLPTSQDLGRRARPGRPSAAGGRAAFLAVSKAVDLALSGDVDGVVTAPLSKEALHRAGHRYPGHTEILAARCPGRRPVMAFFGGPLRIALATVHISLAEAARSLSREKIVRAGQALAEGLPRYCGIPRPRIGVAGLNPHAGEGGLFGKEDLRIVAPAVRELARAGIRASGPWPPDTAFLRARGGEFDGVVALYHDQGLIPVKLLAFDRAVNVTLGLPFVRTSPDHGTAYDIAGKGAADPRPFLAALRMAARGIRVPRV